MLGIATPYKPCGHESDPKVLSIIATEAVGICPFATQIGSPVGRVGDSYDNALAETINGLYQAEVIHKDGPWRGLEEVERATLALFRDQWVAWFNNRRLRPIGDVPPAEFERM